MRTRHWSNRLANYAIHATACMWMRFNFNPEPMATGDERGRGKPYGACIMFW